mmetsp:Transcript_7997/g.8686  ORF Transcript_7997/g.8686 Transcript_7997/m.8686 type:complete len:108 (-) Transcript_7997:326-649(-)
MIHFDFCCCTKSAKRVNPKEIILRHDGSSESSAIITTRLRDRNPYCAYYFQNIPKVVAINQNCLPKLSQGLLTLLEDFIQGFFQDSNESISGCSQESEISFFRGAEA